jgi:outer membrane protein assembly factor BamB
MTTRAGANSAIQACILLLLLVCAISVSAEEEVPFSAAKGKVDSRKPTPLVGKVNIANINADEYHQSVKAYDGGWRTFLQNPCHTSMASVLPAKMPTGKKFWTFPASGGVDSSPVNFQGVVYVGSDDHNVYAVDEHTGKMLWRRELGLQIKSTPAVGDDYIFVGC